MSMDKTAEQLASLKQLTMVVYILQALSFFFGLTAIVGVIINYVKKDEVVGTLYESHFNWQIRTFWWGLLWAVVGFILAFVLIGFAVMYAAWIWAIYRVVKGWLKLNDNLPVVPA
jgi:uncharacterized membrane protein